MTTTSDQPEISGVSAVIVLAAGGGTRMKSQRSKLLHEVAGRPMLSWAVAAARGLHPDHLVVVVGHLRDQVEAHLAEDAPDVATAVQAEQKGTGHAVARGLEGLGDLGGEVVVTYGDVPMLTSQTLADLVRAHRDGGYLATVLTADVPDPTGYGRILRQGERVTGIIEHKDASPTQRLISEINSGIYVFDAEALQQGVAALSNDNAQGEYYLTDVVTMAASGRLSGADRSRGGVGAHRTDDLWQTEGVNDRVQLARINAEVNRRILEGWMRAGVTVADPDTTWIQPDVDLGTDVTILPGTLLNGATSVGEGATIGPDTTLTDCEVGAGAVVSRTEATLAVVGEGVRVGPWANLRPGTVLDAGVRIGAFVETKNAHLGSGTAVPRLVYAGDVTVGRDVTIGAGAMFANTDGSTTSTTTVGDGAFVGSNVVIVAPVDIAEGSFLAAGSTITQDVPAGALAIARERGHISPGWVARHQEHEAPSQSSGHRSGTPGTTSSPEEHL
ncbi:bifunctional UDP-N-acetylglucosamine diphosphorylase/glucosamine-1-phosphate N-acetyltransferase GlmU [Acidipropionibacterium virtanenii]|uniref:Bifunctional protein GlmU n=1 Tax=Acidipropionibacterium virtanenii TaxID=2057246 RepID=A0A344UW23_9ACTN|nr:bifunctional UDP-N-acetylglucosamine diphosphorylase/glucosamine-1-phosphate N-acetyltransferase GlmU [Acidipropionibacterium virtanenii]AXE39471.1 Bifunctional protein GlmU [Acidipropionibacterium virtanenii]